ncbi:MAG: hypothetical protein ACJ8H8_13840 [Geminicoccaceae bacterium]
MSSARYAWLVVLALVAGIAPAHAHSGSRPIGQWTFKLYLEPKLNLVSVYKFCFAADGSFYGIDFPIHGSWFIKGDRWRFTGDYPFIPFQGYGSFFLQFSSNYTASGEINDSIFPGPAQVTNGNALGSRTSTTCEPPAATARSAASKKRLLPG